MTKPKLPKIKLSFILWLILLVVVALELFVLYRAIYTRPELEVTQNQDEAVITRVNLPLFEKAVKWVEDRGAYSLPAYQLQQAGGGRENPFVEYR